MRRVVACIVVSLAFGGCGSKHEAASGCPAPKLAPAHLPSGMRRARTAPFVTSEWSTTWKARTKTVQVAGGVSANIGDVRGSATVRGGPASYGETGIGVAPLAIGWTESVKCGKRSVDVAYAVLVRGVDASEMVRIAQSLRAP